MPVKPDEIGLRQIVSFEKALRAQDINDQTTMGAQVHNITNACTARFGIMKIIERQTTFVQLKRMFGL